ncbi:MAG: acyl carrier protein [Verrucomicrobiia bacterium]
MRDLHSILKSIRPESDFSSSQDFVMDGLLDSFDVITLVSTLDKTYGISIPGDEIVPENFKNAETIQALLRKCGVTE